MRSEDGKNPFAPLSEDLVLAIFLKLEDDPRHWARLACVCTRFSSLVRHSCCRLKCSLAIPFVVSDLLSSAPAPSASPPGGWPSLLKLSVCCPGLLHSGVLLEHSDFGLDQDLGPHLLHNLSPTAPPPLSVTPSPSPSPSWSLLDDLYLDTLYAPSEPHPLPTPTPTVALPAAGEFSVRKRRRIKLRSVHAHLASSLWNLSREQGNKLLASRFRGDCLYICDRPGCVHSEEKRNYMLFRGVFKDFKLSRVWRTICDGNRTGISLGCAFCSCKQTWDLHSAFCLRRVFGFHEDGEPVVRAYVCENGHVSGAWTDRPMYA